MIILLVNTGDVEALIIETHKEKIGPLKVNHKIFTIELTKQRILDGKEEVHFKETVESFEIRDDKGQVHYKKYLGAKLDPHGFMDEWNIKGFVLEGKNGNGLILYYRVLPSAPGSGILCQVFTLEKERLFPISLPITTYGEIQSLPKGSTRNSLRLFKEDMMRFKVWTGNFSVIVPLLVAWKEREIRPLKIEGDFDVEAERVPTEEEGVVHLFAKPDSSAPSKEVSLKRDSKIRFLKAYGKVLMEKSSDPGNEFLHLSIHEPWLKVVVDKIEGWVKDKEDLHNLGLPSAS